jgi:cystathionine gamma-synthase
MSEGSTDLLQLASLCLNKFGRDQELCMLFPSPKVAAEARDFLAHQNPSIPSRIVEFVICPSLSNVNVPPAPEATSSTTTYTPASVEVIELQILLFNKDHWSFAKSFWQHTGDGVSSRLAERALDFMGETPSGVQPQPTNVEAGPKKNTHYSKNRHYAKRQQSVSTTPAATVPSTPATPIANPLAKQANDENLTPDLSTYLEERYGRNLPLFNAPLAKQALKRRIAGGLLPSDEDFGKVDDVSRGAEAGSGKKAVTPDDVYLYPGGMSAIWHAHDISRKVRRRSGEAEGKSLSYGYVTPSSRSRLKLTPRFPYIDTLKILEKWGPGGILFGQGGSDDIEPLKQMLQSRKPDEPRILALFCEFPGNPLLRSPDLAKIRELADKHGFIVVVDETIGNFINVECMTYADIVVSSLTKIFSGESNVMGGR